ncbi:MAG: hypothetical protein J6M18_04595 [Actinomycetaceae bacterium]|nr:hypothetical protein [Actinomycetaceae bacterium]
MKRLWAIFLAVFSLLSLFGCSVLHNSSVSNALVPMEDVRTEDVVAVMSLNRSAQDIDRFRGGYYVFIKKDGSYELVDQEFTDYTNLQWNKKNLLLTGRKYDYLLTENTETVKHTVAKEALGSEFSLLLDDGLYMSFWNWGFSHDRKGGYDYELIVGNREKVNRYELPYSVESKPVVCGGKILGITQEVFLQDENMDNVLEATQELRSFHTDGSSKVIEHYKKLKLDGVDTAIQPSYQSYYCHNDSFIVGVADVYQENIQPEDLFVIVDAIDIQTGKRKVIPVVDSENKKVNVTEWNTWHIENNILFGTADHGRIVKVNIDTGIAEFINESFEKSHSDNMGSGYPHELYETYANGKLYQFIYKSDLGETPYIRILDMESGKEIQHIEIQNLNDVMKSGLIPKGFAANPNF